MIFLLLLSTILVLDVKAQKLDEIILKNIIPSVGSKCQSNFARSATNITSKTTFTHQKSQSYWDAMADPYEKDLFLAEMSHENDNDDRQSWTIRIGKGSNIYSFRGKYGEAMPPQFHENSVFIDEVTQSVSVNQEKNRNSGKPYFIHQAGIYTKDGDFTPKIDPFFSPNIAKHCGIYECLSGSWGQQAHVPTFHRSDILYFNGYRDCGDGVLEFTSVIHNAADDLDNGDDVSYLNVPWGGVRRSNLRDLLISNVDGTLEHKYPMPSFFDTQITDMRETGGFTTFTEDIKASDEAFAANTFTMPKVDGQNLDLVVASGLTVDDPVKSEQWNMPCFRTNIEKTVIVKTGCQFCSLYFTNEDGYRFYVPEIIHWAWEGKYIYYCGPLRDPTDRSVREDAHAWKLNNHLTVGTKITVSLANEGKPEEDNSALTFVHGLDDSLTNQWASNRLRYGWAGGARRDYTVYTGNVRVAINPGDTYVYQQYIVSGGLTEMATLAPLWVDEVYEDLYSLGEMSGTTIRLYSDDESKFGATVDINSSCSKRHLRCEGISVPHFGRKALFAISCGNKNYVGSDKYYFSPTRSDDTDIIRPYLCDGEDSNVRPEWKLLGFFVEGSCSFLQSAEYDDSFCTLDTSLEDNTKNETGIPTNSPSTVSSSEPSNIVTQFPSISTTSMPSVNHTITPSAYLTDNPSVSNSMHPSVGPSSTPSIDPTSFPSVTQSNNPSVEPTSEPSIDFTLLPSIFNFIHPSVDPSDIPSIDPSNVPSVPQSNNPSMESTSEPSIDLTTVPSILNSIHPSVGPSIGPSIDPTTFPSVLEAIHTSFPSVSKSTYPSVESTFGSSPVSSINSMHQSDRPTLSNLSIFSSATKSIQPTIEYTYVPSVTNVKYPSNESTFDFADDFTNSFLTSSINPTIYPSNRMNSIPPSVIALNKPVVSVSRIHTSNPSTPIPNGSFNSSQELLSETPIFPQINTSSSTTNNLTSRPPVNDDNLSLPESLFSSSAIYLKFQSLPIYFGLTQMIVVFFLL